METFVQERIKPEKKELLKYFKSLGISVYTSTKARGHQGFFLKNRIDISRNTPENRVVPTLLHEFAHYIHSKIEPDMPAAALLYKTSTSNSNTFFRSSALVISTFNTLMFL